MLVRMFTDYAIVKVYSLMQHLPNSHNLYAWLATHVRRWLTFFQVVVFYEEITLGICRCYILSRSFCIDLVDLIYDLYSDQSALVFFPSKHMYRLQLHNTSIHKVCMYVRGGGFPFSLATSGWVASSHNCCVLKHSSTKTTCS